MRKVRYKRAAAYSSYARTGARVTNAPAPRYVPLSPAGLRFDSGHPAKESFFIGNAEEVLEALARHSGDCVKLLDLDGHVLRWNSTCEDLYGWNAHEVLGKVLPHIAEENRLHLISDLRAVAAGDCVVERDGQAMRSDGSRIMLHMVLIPVFDQDGDASAIMSLTRELGADTRHERHRNDFVEVVSRELRDPLTAVLGFTQLLQHPAIINDEVRRSRTVRALSERAGQMSALLDDLHVVFELERGELELAVEPTNLATAVSDAVSRVHGAEARVVVDFDPRLGPIPADRRRLTQAIASLINNALRHTPKDASVGVSLYGTATEVVIEVADTGPGIDTSERDRIFDRFYSGTSTEGGREGLGIGLFLARVIAEAHGGFITVASLPAAGSTFAIRLPRAEAQSGREAAS